jgi:hypothetical protein
MAHRLSRTAARAAAVVLLLGLSVPAYAATGSPPVTNPDQLRVRAGDFASVDLTANDKDPDGDQLDVCRLGPLPRHIEAGIDGDYLVVTPDTQAKGTYTLTYYACDDSYLTAGTVTVVVGPPRQSFDIFPVAFEPHVVLKLVNTYKHKTFHCTWSPVGGHRVAGRATVKPRATVRVQVGLDKFDIECDAPGVMVSASFE